MTVKKMTFKCPRCASVFHLDKAAVRTEAFVCPVCLEGEITRPATQSEIDGAAITLLGKAGRWVILHPPLEPVSKS